MKFEISIENLNVKPNGKYNPMDTICLAKESELYTEILDDYYIWKNIKTINYSSEVLKDHFDTMVNLYKEINSDKSKYIALEKFNRAFISFLGTISPVLKSFEEYCTTDYFKTITSNFYDKHISYRMFSILRDISQHKPVNIKIIMNDNFKLIVNKSLLLENYHISKIKKSVIFDLLPEDIDILPHINTFFMNILEMKEWIFVNNFDIKKQERFFKTISRYELDNHTYIRKKYENGDIDYLNLNPNFKDLVKDSIEYYYNKCTVIGKTLGVDFNYIDYFNN